MKQAEPPTWLPPALQGRLALRPQEAADALGIHRNTLEHEIQSGRLLTKKLGHARLIPIENLIAWLQETSI